MNLRGRRGQVSTSPGPIVSGGFLAIILTYTILAVTPTDWVNPFTFIVIFLIAAVVSGCIAYTYYRWSYRRLLERTTNTLQHAHTVLIAEWRRRTRFGKAIYPLWILKELYELLCLLLFALFILVMVKFFAAFNTTGREVSGVGPDVYVEESEKNE